MDKVLSPSDQQIQLRINSVLPYLDEFQTRIYLGAEAQSAGRGGKSKISLLSGVCRRSITRGIKEAGETLEKGRIRKKGGGRKKKSAIHPNLLNDISDLISAHTMGDPENPLIWCSKSIRKVAVALQDKGYEISHETVRTSMQKLGYSLQSNRKTKEGGDCPDRDAQFQDS